MQINYTLWQESWLMVRLKGQNRARPGKHTEKIIEREKENCRLETKKQLKYDFSKL